MAGFSRFKDIIDATPATRYYTWRKSPTQVTTAGVWFDFAMSPGNPSPKYWFDATPLIAVQVKQSTDGGMFHGADVAPATKFLKELMVMCNIVTPLAMPLMLCDYLLYYPTIDESVTDPQIMTNNVALPRYTDGVGVQMIAVSDASRTGGQTFTVTYTNSAGVAGRVTPVITENGNAVTGSLVNSARISAGGSSSGPFIQLQAGDTGVQSVQSITMQGSDTGLFSLVLVKPLAQLCLIDIDAPIEVDYYKNFSQLIPIQADAYLNLLGCPTGSVFGVTLTGSITTIFN